MTAAGDRMVADLLAVHRPLRADVEMREKALTLLGDAVVEPVAAMINDLTVADFLWQLRVTCNTYCNHLAVHHMIADVPRDGPKVHPFATGSGTS